MNGMCLCAYVVRRTFEQDGEMIVDNGLPFYAINEDAAKKMLLRDIYPVIAKLPYNVAELELYLVGALYPDASDIVLRGMEASLICNVADLIAESEEVSDEQ